ncbi:MAG: GIY-YIG nuclease family protein [Pseudolysinimonas sp.]
MDPLEPEAELVPRQEIEQLLESDEGRIGDVYRLTKDGLSPQEIADRLNVASYAFVYNNRRHIDAVLDGRGVVGPVFRRQTMGVFSSLILRGRAVLSGEAMKLLLANRAAVEAAGADEDPVTEATAASEEEREAASTLTSLDGVSGIYAFSYGWYLESPVDPSRGNTLIKVGQSVNVAQRIREHTSKARAHMPEPLTLIRVYSTDGRDVGKLEHGFHELLRTAGHNNPRRTGREVGVEWFLTNEDFLDAIASTLGLRTLYTGRSEFAAD